MVNSVHYATLATLAFRMLGTPARYVEGYMISLDDVDGLQPFSEIDIAEKMLTLGPKFM